MIYEISIIGGFCLIVICFCLIYNFRKKKKDLGNSSSANNSKDNSDKTIIQIPNNSHQLKTNQSDSLNSIANLQKFFASNSSAPNAKRTSRNFTENFKTISKITRNFHRKYSQKNNSLIVYNSVIKKLKKERDEVFQKEIHDILKIQNTLNTNF